MDMRVEWQAPVPLVNGSKEGLIYVCDPERLPDVPGVYVFGRRFGASFEALYVGKATKSIRRRVGQQFQRVPLMVHVRDAMNGKRVLLAGCYSGRKGMPRDRCIAIIERALIRYFLSEGHDLVNISGTRLRQHSIHSVGARRILPQTMLLDHR